MPTMIAEKFARAMGETLYLPAAVLIIGIVAALLFTNPHRRLGRHAIGQAPKDPADKAVTA